MQGRSITFAHPNVIIWTVLLVCCTVTSPIVVVAALSEQCQTQTEILGNNTALIAAAPSLSCNIDLDVSDSCTVDYSTVSSEYERLCLEAGGQFQEQDLIFDCSETHPYTGKVYNADYYLFSVPACFGMNCTIDEYEQEQEQVLFPTVLSALTAGGLENCAIKTSSFGTNKNGSLSSGSAPTAVAVSALPFALALAVIQLFV